MLDGRGLSVPAREGGSRDARQRGEEKPPDAAFLLDVSSSVAGAGGFSLLVEMAGAEFCGMFVRIVW